MIQVKEFLDTNNSSAEKKTNDFLATIREDQLIDIRYSTGMKAFGTTTEQRSYILVIYRADPA